MRFLVESRLAQAPAPEILALIPTELARGQELDVAGVREALYVAADNSSACRYCGASHLRCCSMCLRRSRCTRM
jgi:hypothetical protein